MCIIFVKPEGVKIPIGTLRSGWLANPNGWGIMRLGKKGPFTRKGVGSIQEGFESFLNNYKMFEDFACVIHFRAGTEESEENAHPFNVKDDLWVAHNGTFDELPMWNPKLSDTWHFSRYMSHYAADIRTPFMQFLLRSTWQKLVFMDSNGIIIIDPNSWYRDKDGVFYSNIYGWAIPKDKRIFQGNKEIVINHQKKKFRAVPITEEDDKSFGDYRDWWKTALAKQKTRQENAVGAALENADTRESLIEDERDSLTVVAQEQQALPLEDTRRSIVEDITGFSRADLVEFCKHDPSLMQTVIRDVLIRM